MFAILNLTAALKKCELGQRLHLAEHLSDGEFFVKEESLAQLCCDGDVAPRDADSLSVAQEVDFAALGYGLLGRSHMCTGGRLSVDRLDVDCACKEGTM